MANQAEKNLLGAEDLIGYLLKEPKILQKVLSSLKPQARTYSNVRIVKDEERIYFGKYGWGGFTGFWNNLIKCSDHISYDDFYIKVWDALLEMTSNTVAHTAILEGLSKEMLIQGIHAKDQNILHRFFDVCRHVTDDGYWRDKGLKSNSAVHHHSNSCPFSGDVEVEISSQKKQHCNITVVDSVGDPFEVIGLRWMGGRH